MQAGHSARGRYPEQCRSKHLSIERLTVVCSMCDKEGEDDCADSRSHFLCRAATATRLRLSCSLSALRDPPSLTRGSSYGSKMVGIDIDEQAASDGQGRVGKCKQLSHALAR